MIFRKKCLHNLDNNISASIRFEQEMKFISNVRGLCSNQTGENAE